MENNVKIMVELIERTLDEKKAQDIVVLDVAKQTVIAEAMVIASGRSVIQVKSLAQEVEEKMAEAGHELRRRDGQQEGRWVILDYANVLVHVFHQEERAFYNLERLWDQSGLEVSAKENLSIGAE